MIPFRVGGLGRAGAILALILAGCGGEAETVPTPPPESSTILPPLVNTPVLYPVLPAGDGSGGEVVGASNPTLAALPAEGEPDQLPSAFAPVPTQAQLPMMIGAADGLVIAGTLYTAPIRPAPAVLLLHTEGGDRASWGDLTDRLQAAGYAVLAVDLRGHGATGGAVDWSRAGDDVAAALALLGATVSIRHDQIAVIGAGAGANLGLNACADFIGCAAVVLLSPSLDYQGITTADAILRLGARPALIVASENDGSSAANSATLDGVAQGDHRLVIYPAAGHGTAMLTAEPGLSGLIIEWLLVHLPPPVLRP